MGVAAVVLAGEGFESGLSEGDAVSLATAAGEWLGVVVVPHAIKATHDSTRSRRLRDTRRAYSRAVMEPSSGSMSP